MVGGTVVYLECLEVIAEEMGGGVPVGFDWAFAICTAQVLVVADYEGGTRRGGGHCTGSGLNWGEGCDYWGNSRPCCSLYRVALGLAAGQSWSCDLGFISLISQKILRVTSHSTMPDRRRDLFVWSWTFGHLIPDRAGTGKVRCGS